MIAKVGLLASLALLWLNAITQRTRARRVSYLMSAIAAGGMLLVIAPNWATGIAVYVGVGRGADLVIYFFIVLTLATVFNLHIRLRAERQAREKVVRTLALITARQPGQTA